MHWGWRVSICLAAFFGNGEGIVVASDEKVSFGNYSAENAAIKTQPLLKNWEVLYAGDDVEHVPVIIRRARHLLKDFKKPPNIGEIVGALDTAYKERIHHEIEARVLRKHGFTVDTFRDRGKQKCTATVYNNLCERISRVEVSLKFLLCGFDTIGQGHIFEVNGQSAPRCYDHIGMWAIGSGAHAALSSLAFQKDSGNYRESSMEQVIYHVCEAKFMAESSGDVGRDSTILLVLMKDKSTKWIPPSIINSKIKAAWKKEGAPRIPENICGDIGKVVLSFDEWEARGPE